MALHLDQKSYQQSVKPLNIFLLFPIVLNLPCPIQFGFINTLPVFFFNIKTQSILHNVIRNGKRLTNQASSHDPFLFNCKKLKLIDKSTSSRFQSVYNVILVLFFCIFLVIVCCCCRRRCLTAVSYR